MNETCELSTDAFIMVANGIIAANVAPSAGCVRYSFSTAVKVWWWRERERYVQNFNKEKVVRSRHYNGIVFIRRHMKKKQEAWR